MREIKFRAWHPKTKEMRDVETIDWDETGYLTEVTAGYTWGEKFRPADFQQLVLMQFTGLKDKNGKEIFEGDVVKRSRYGNWDDDEVSVTEVKSIQEFFEDKGLYEREYGQDYEDGKMLEVIGNIYGESL